MPGILEMLERVAKTKGLDWGEFQEKLKHNNQAREHCHTLCSQCAHRRCRPRSPPTCCSLFAVPRRGVLNASPPCALSSCFSTLKFDVIQSDVRSMTFPMPSASPRRAESAATLHSSWTGPGGHFALVLRGSWCRDQWAHYICCSCPTRWGAAVLQGPAGARSMRPRSFLQCLPILGPNVGFLSLRRRRMRCER